MGIVSFTFLSASLFFFFCELYMASDTIIGTESMREGSTLVSKAGKFELGFFSPGSSKNRYLGIWYNDIPDKAVVWVANRRNPINDISGTLMINKTGHAVLLGQKSGVVWSAKPSRAVQAPVLQLLDSGNLVLVDETDGNEYLWQSFDYPCDTLLPGMKLGWDLKAGLERRLVSWKSPDDPSPGDLSWGITLYEYPDAVAWKGSNKFFRDGPWNGIRLSGFPELTPTNPLFRYDFVSNEDEVYYIFYLKNETRKSRLVMNQTNGYIRHRYAWSPEIQSWDVFYSAPRDSCDNYATCGANEVCIFGEPPPCQCLKGFKPKGTFVDWSRGCVRNKPFNCQDKHSSGFVQFRGLKLPDTTYTWVNRSLNLKECRAKCLSNCSCSAFTNYDIRGKGSGCVMWFGDLMDIREIKNGQYLYIRMHSSEFGGNNEHKVKIIVTVLAVFSVVCGMFILARYIHKFRTGKKLNDNIEAGAMMKNHNNESQTEDLEVLFFELDTIVKATNNFSSSNKLGEGGFGSVYKGTLEDGSDIAVKRLSRSSVQGVNEFKNEIILIAKLQHRNLVKLLGCCLHGEDKMLIYEYMPNNSLDYFIFDQTKGKLLDWSKRYHIICGIARGLLYLHQDSRLRIIHRDLKASNVLLDNEMNPKISDFGLARTFGGDHSEGNTKRVVGTYGYMAPEYAIDGLFSVKSDVFSFGILLLEIVSGKKSRGFCNIDHSLNLIGHAWKLWKEGRPLELVNPCIEDSSNHCEVLRSIHIGLLCVQERPEDRPSMSCVVVMLGSESALPQPKKPAFLFDKETVSSGSLFSKFESSSTNQVTVTRLTPR